MQRCSLMQGMSRCRVRTRGCVLPRPPQHAQQQQRYSMFHQQRKIVLPRKLQNGAIQPRWPRSSHSSCHPRNKNVVGRTTTTTTATTVPAAKGSSSKSTKKKNHNQHNSNLIDVTDLALEMRQSVRKYTLSLPPDRSSSKTRPTIRMVGVMADLPHCAAGASHRGRSDAERYSDMIQATFAADGLDYEVHRCPGTPDDVESAIRTLNDRPDVHGILVFYPMFPQRSNTMKTTTMTTTNAGTSTLSADSSSSSSTFYINPTNGVHYIKANPPHYIHQATGVHYATVDDYLRDCVAPAKDVEGLSSSTSSSNTTTLLSSAHHRKLFRARRGKHSDTVYMPCTVTAVMRILERFHHQNRRNDNGSSSSRSPPPMVHDLPRKQQQQQQHHHLNPPDDPWKGATITVINRSNILGRPLAALLALDGASVYSVDDTSIVQFLPGGTGTAAVSAMTLSACVRQSSVVVTAVPGTNFCLDVEVIAEGTTVVDVSEWSNVPDDDDGVLQSKGIRLVRNVGRVTVAALEQNLIRLFDEQRHAAAAVSSKDDVRKVT